MLWARCQSGSSVSAVNSPESAAPFLSAASPPPTRLSNRASSQISSTSSGPETISRVPPGTLSLKIGPYFSAIAMNPSMGLSASTSNAFPTRGSPEGPGMSSRSIVMLMRRPLVGEREVGGRGPRRPGGVDEQYDAEQQHPAGEHQQGRRVEGGAEEQERGTEMAHDRQRAGEERPSPNERGRRDHVHAGGTYAEDEHHAVAGGGERASHLGGGQRRGGEDRQQRHGTDGRRTREEHADEEHAGRELEPAGELGRRAGQRLDEHPGRA